MEASSDVRAAFAQLLDLGRGLAGGGHFEAAYHALMAAVHCAEDAADPARLAEVAGLLRHYRGVIDAIRSPHKLSTSAAHGGRGIYEMGAVSAEMVIKRLASEHRLHELREEMERPARPDLPKGRTAPHG